MSRPYDLPTGTIVLHPGAMRAGAAYEAMGITRQTAANWRRSLGLPATVRGRIDSRELALWLMDRCDCRIKWG
jgi:hypothetical protein